MSNRNPKKYIGDSVYVELNDAEQLVLTTENGYSPSNTIVLEPEVFQALISYVKTTKASDGK